MRVFVYRTTDVEGVVRELTARGLVFTPEKHGTGPSHFSARWRDALIEVYPSTGERDCDRCAGVEPSRPTTVCRSCLEELHLPIARRIALSPVASDDSRHAATGEIIAFELPPARPRR